MAVTPDPERVEQYVGYGASGRPAGYSFGIVMAIGPTEFYVETTFNTDITEWNRMGDLPYGGRTVVTPEPGALTLEDLPRPENGPAEVLVENSKTLISPGTESSIIEGKIGNQYREQYGSHMFTGYIGLGRVVDVGEDVDGFEVGDRVYTGMPHAEYVIADPSADWARTIVPVPDGASDIEGLFLGPAQIAMVALRRGTVEWGETVLVFGQGFIGHVATRLAHFAGARPVIAVNRSQPRLDYLPDLSGLETVRSDRDGWEEEVRACNGGAPVDVVVEATGNPSAIQTPFEVLKQGGRCVIASSPTESTEFDFRSHGSDQSVDIHGAIVRSPATGGSGDPWPLSRQAALYFDILDEPELDGLASVVDTYPSADAVQAFDDLENREIDGISAVIEWE